MYLGSRCLSNKLLDLYNFFVAIDLRHNRADFIERHNEISLPTGVGFILAQLFAKGQALLVEIERIRELAL